MLRMQNTCIYTDMLFDNFTDSLCTYPDSQNSWKVCACENRLWQASFSSRPAQDGNCCLCYQPVLKERCRSKKFH